MTNTIGTIAAHHADNAALNEAVTSLYADVDRQIAAYQPNCINRGQCCNFKTYGHRLYVSTVELTHFVHGQRAAWQPADPEVGQCPYQIEGTCTARDHRPLGCRIFFCESESDGWPADIYERALREAQQIAAAHGVEYRYVEWLSALESVPATTVRSVEPEIPSGQKIDPLSLPVIDL